MKYFLPCFCFLLSCFAAQAQQCDYSTLIKDGRALFEKQQYRAAIKKFNAARTCDPSKSAEVDQEVARVFNAIEEQRDEAKKQRGEALLQKQRAEAASLHANNERDKANEALALAKVMQDSAMQANKGKYAAEEQTALLTELYDLQKLGDNFKVKRKYAEALVYYEKLIARLNQVSEWDTILTQKHALVMDEIQSGRLLLDKQVKFNVLIDSADYHRNQGFQHFPEAYHFYLDAVALQYDSLMVLRRLSQMELSLSDRVKPRKGIKGTRYYELLSLSAEANLLMGSAPMARNRISGILKYSPRSVDFIKSNALANYARLYRNKFKHRLSIYYGVRILFPNLMQDKYRYDIDAYFPFTVGGNLDFKNGRSGVSVDAGFHNAFYLVNYYDNSNNMYADFRNAQISFSYYHNILDIRSKKWNNSLLKIQGICGIGYGGSSAEYWDERGTFIVPENLRAKLPQTGVFKNTKIDGYVEYSVSEFDPAGTVYYSFDRLYDNGKNYNYIYWGLRFILSPFKVHSIYILSEASFGRQIMTINNSEVIDLRDEVLEHFSPLYENSEADWNAFKEAVPNNVIEYRNNFPELNSAGLMLKLGIGHRF